MHRLYYSPGSCSLAPHIVLEEIGEPYETELVAATDGAMTRTDRWRAINPKARVPALSAVPGSIGGQPCLLTEVAAIVTYLADTHPEAGLLPADPAWRARAAEWMNWLSGAVHAMAFGQIWRPERFSDDVSAHGTIKEKGLSSLRDHAAYIDSLLGDGRGWAVPTGYSVVDPYLLVFWRWSGIVGLDTSGLVAWAEHAERVKERPAVRRVMAFCGIE
ncbi:glutathione S-transferase family protein [Sphingomonas corticis]|uniref:Glutathione S-transferase n=1 Tax=Sphingomonas corticis TaxID=2722791 RepID=A0ABX1CVJ1_9SPHN|nr:glutathione S-transferase N-terminal domain-containing protein [Sphingomonas corticis]NJR80305.1 glutathione S-transferase [Sphingomonas corticis]